PLRTFLQILPVELVGPLKAELVTKRLRVVVVDQDERLARSERIEGLEDRGVLLAGSELGDIEFLDVLHGIPFCAFARRPSLKALKYVLEVIRSLRQAGKTKTVVLRFKSLTRINGSFHCGQMALALIDVARRSLLDL